MDGSLGLPGLVYLGNSKLMRHSILGKEGGQHLTLAFTLDHARMCKPFTLPPKKQDFLEYLGSSPGLSCWTVTACTRAFYSQSLRYPDLKTHTT